MRKVFEARHHLEAHLVCGLLEAEGIPSEVRGEALFTTVEAGAVLPGMRPSVWIHQDAQLAESMSLIEGYVRGGMLPGTEGSPWLCGSCGESHEPQFTSCWKCGAEAPSGPTGTKGA